MIELLLLILLAIASPAQAQCSTGFAPATAVFCQPATGNTLVGDKVNHPPVGDNSNFDVANGPFTIVAPQTVNDMSMLTYGGGMLGNVIKVGIYDNTGPNGPGALLASTAFFAPSGVATGHWQTIPLTTPVTLQPGTYWPAYIILNNATVFGRDFSTGHQCFGGTVSDLSNPFPTAGFGCNQVANSLCANCSGLVTDPPLAVVTNCSNGTTSATTNQMAILAPCSPNGASSNQVTTPALIGIGIDDATATVAAGSVPISVKALGAGDVEVWTHNSMAVRLTNNGGGSFTGSLNLSAEPAGPLHVMFHAWDVTPPAAPALHLQAEYTLFVAGTRTPIPVSPGPVAANGLIPTFTDHFSSLNTAPCKPGTGQWPGCTAPPGSDGYRYAQNFFNGLDFGDSAEEHTGASHNPFTILPQGGLRIRMQNDTAYTDPYGFNRKWYSGALTTGFKDLTTTVPNPGDGYYEARVLIPNGACGASGNNTCSGGTWPQFWMLSINDPNSAVTGKIELDMDEQYGSSPNYLQQFTHVYTGAFYPNATGAGGSTTNGDYSWDWHTVAMLVTGSGTATGQICTYIDDVIQNCAGSGSMPQYGAPNSAVKPAWSIFNQIELGGGWVENAPPAGYYDYFTDWIAIYQPPPPAFYVSPSGNDGNAGTLAAPFQTIHQCKQAMEGSSTKTCFIRAGSYAPAAADASICGGTTTCAVGLSSTSDNNMTFSYYPPDGFDSADITGGTTTDGTGLWDIFWIGNTTGVTINGLKIHNFNYAGIDSGGGAHNVTIKNNEIYNGICVYQTGSCVSSAMPSAVKCFGCVNSLVTHNYVHDMNSFGIGFSNVNGDISNLVIADNYVQNICKGLRDCGAIYLIDTAQIATNLRVVNNYVRDGCTNSGCVAGGGGWGAGIYLDDCQSNVTVAGNVVSGSSGSNNLMIHGGSGNKFTGNLVDLGTNNNPILREQSSSCAAVTGNVFQNNIIVSNGVAGGYNGVAGTVTVSNNAYKNYGSGTLSSSGDASPVVEDPKLNCWSYLIDRSSPVYNSPVSFPSFANSWGWPDFVVPQTGSPPAPPHACS